MSYLRNEVSKILDLPIRRIKFYSESGLIPNFVSDTGRGVERRYSTTDIFYLAIINEFSKSKLNLSYAKSALSLISNRFNWVTDFENYKKESFKPFGFIRIIEDDLYLDIASIEPKSYDFYLMLKEYSITITLNFSKIFHSINW